MTSCCLSLNRRKFFQINALDPLLQFLRVLVLQLDLKGITIGNHYPESGMSAFFLECFKRGVAIDGDRLAVTFGAFASVLPRIRGGADVVGVGDQIYNANCCGWRFLPVALVVIAMHVRDFESTDIFRGALRLVSRPALRRFR